MNNAKSRRPARDSVLSAPDAEEHLPISAAPADPAEGATDASARAAPSVFGEDAASEPPAPIAPAPIAAPPAATPTAEPAAAALAASVDGWMALAQLQAALAHACEEVAVELTGVTGSGIAAGTDAALALLDARTYAEAIEINAALAQRGVAALVAGSARLSEIGVKAMAEAARPLFASLSGPAPAQLPR